jgi:hypothetical protein
MHCSIETGGFEHELEAILGEAHEDAAHAGEAAPEAGAGA